MIYRATGFSFRDWGRALFQTAPRLLRGDPALKLAALVFLGTFLLTTLVSAGRPEFARIVVGDAFLEQIDHDFAQPVFSERPDGLRRSDTAMAGFYIQHNASIGLSCFAWGIVFGLGSLYQLLFNAIIIGTLVRPHDDPARGVELLHTS